MLAQRRGHLGIQRVAITASVRSTASRVMVRYTSDQYVRAVQRRENTDTAGDGECRGLADGERGESQGPPKERHVLNGQSPKDEREGECRNDGREPAVAVDMNRRPAR